MQGYKRFEALNGRMGTTLVVEADNYKDAAWIAVQKWIREHSIDVGDSVFVAGHQYVIEEINISFKFREEK